jgi:hypothetical protein
MTEEAKIAGVVCMSSNAKWEFLWDGVTGLDLLNKCGAQS